MWVKLNNKLSLLKLKEKVKKMFNSSSGFLSGLPYLINQRNFPFAVFDTKKANGNDDEEMFLFIH